MRPGKLSHEGRIDHALDCLRHRAIDLRLVVGADHADELNVLGTAHWSSASQVMMLRRQTNAKQLVQPRGRLSRGRGSQSSTYAVHTSLLVQRSKGPSVCVAIRETLSATVPLIRRAAATVMPTVHASVQAQVIRMSMPRWGCSYVSQ